jgi:NRPS condensation-like uncharacterized protein
VKHAHTTALRINVGDSINITAYEAAVRAAARAKHAASGVR